MSNEIRVSAWLEALKSNFKFPRIGKSMSLDMNGIGGGGPGMVEVGESVQIIRFSELDRPGWLFMLNYDDEAYIDWGFGPTLGAETGTGTGAGNDGLGGRMEPGEFALFRLHPAGELAMRASAVGVRIQVVVLED